MTPEQVRQIIREELSGLIKSDRYTIQKDIQMFDGRNFQLAKGTGTIIGTEATQKLAFYGETPVTQGTAIANISPVGSDSDGSCRDRLNDVINRLVALGLIAS